MPSIPWPGCSSCPIFTRHLKPVLGYGIYSHGVQSAKPTANHQCRGMGIYGACHGILAGHIGGLPGRDRSGLVHPNQRSRKTVEYPDRLYVLCHRSFGGQRVASAALEKQSGRFSDGTGGSVFSGLVSTVTVPLFFIQVAISMITAVIGSTIALKLLNKHFKPAGLM